MTPSSANTSDEPAGTGPGPSKRTFPAGGPTPIDKRRLRDKLRSMRAEILRSNQDLADEALKGSGQDFSVDHMADHASDNAEQEISISLLEGEAELLLAVDGALAKIDGRGDLPYGICEACAVDGWEEGAGTPWIPTPRLDVLPYAPLCVTHQEAQEEG